MARIDGDVALPLAVQLLSEPLVHPVNDRMNEIYERFAACHGVLFVTPVYWSR